ncbi:HD domain-containing protein [Nocardia sp. CNY236]|uniref:HD domain-containing protein n=1 Tax=Nocardia sp. CNY236 TaxID=1169152 RepID=UPI00041EA237|nr:HD domain-containing protein [Nocardia sp. CNY236]
MGPKQVQLDYYWARRTKGTLTAVQEAQVYAQLAGRAARDLPHALLAKVRAHQTGTGRLDLDNLRIPDTSLTRAAVTAAQSTLSPSLLEHSFRTYLFGRALAELDNSDYDPELLYAASLLHDIALEDPVPGTCFSVRGARRARDIAHQSGISSDRADELAAAIATHMTLNVRPDTPAGIVGAGTAVDLFGMRVDDLDPHFVRRAVARHPRHRLKPVVMEAMKREAAAHPRGRTAILLRWPPTLARIRQAPFAE